jgi:hypothetical protein
VNFQSNGLAAALYRCWKASSRAASASLPPKSAGLITLRWITENTTSTWFSHEACTGRCTMTAFGYASLIRAAAAQFRWEAPLSTTQKTRRAEAYGRSTAPCSVMRREEPAGQDEGPYRDQSASVGDMRAARRAGSNPAKTPMRIAAPIPPAQATAGMTTAQPLAWA